MRYLVLLATIYAAAVGTSSALIDANTTTTIAVDACGHYGPKESPYGPENTLDGSRSGNSRWSCKGDLLDNDEGCCIRYTFEEPQDIVEIQIAFYKGKEDKRTLKVYDNGSYHSKITSSGSTNGYQTFVLDTDETEELKLRLDDDDDVWISITEVKFMV